MEIRLVVDEQSLDLNWETVETLVGSLPDEGAPVAGILEALSRSEVAAVRRAVAGKRSLPEECAERLASDSNPDVIDALLQCQAAKLSLEAVRAIIQRDWSSANRQVGCCLREFSRCDVTALAALLAASSDPAVREAVASNWDSPSAVLRQLALDPDPSIRRLARNGLARLGVE